MPPKHGRHFPGAIDGTSIIDDALLWSTLDARDRGPRWHVLEVLEDVLRR